MSFTHAPKRRVAASGAMSDAERQTRIDLAAAYRAVWDSKATISRDPAKMANACR